MSIGYWITPNRVTVARVLLGSAAILIYASARTSAALWGSVAVIMTMSAISLDGVDGWLARRMNRATAIGAQLDVLGDRVLENVYFIYFAANGQIPVWVPVIFFVRGAATDFLRGIARDKAGRENEADEAFIHGPRMPGAAGAHKV